jgi:hypothetical protein
MVVLFMNKKEGRSVKTCPILDPIKNMMRKPKMLPAVAEKRTDTYAMRSLLTSEPMKTNRTSLGEGGKRFSMRVNKNAANMIPSSGRPCK